MKIADVVRHLRIEIPRITDKYSKVLDINTISGNGSIVTTITNQLHGLVIGSPIYFTGVETQYPITEVTIDGNIAIIKTSIAHDLTLGWHETATLSGFTDSFWNADFTLIAVPNRKTFHIQVSLTTVVPVLNGNETLDLVVSGGYNISTVVESVVDDNTFTYSNTETSTVKDGVVHVFIRITGAVSFDKCFEEYTAQKKEDLWLFVTQPSLVSLSKDRNAEGDAVSEQNTNTSHQLNLLDGFHIYAFLSTKDSKTALTESDIARDDILKDLFKTVVGWNVKGFPDGRTSVVVLKNHNPALYDGSKYVHEFVFEVGLRITQGDIYKPLETVAFRDVGLIIKNPDYPESERKLTAEVDLDEEPLET